TRPPRTRRPRAARPSRAAAPSPGRGAEESATSRRRPPQPPPSRWEGTASKMSRTVVIVIGIAGVLATGGVAYAVARRRRSSPGSIAAHADAAAGGYPGANVVGPPPP